MSNDSIKTSTTSTTSNTADAIEFPLKYEWRLLVFKNWQQQHLASTWTSINDFWSTLNNVQEPSTFRMPINFAIFRQDSAMTWEHESNKHCGRWIFSIDSDTIVSDNNKCDEIMSDNNNCDMIVSDNSNSDSTNATALNNKLSKTRKLIDHVWIKLLMHVVGLSDRINGIVINVRAAGHRINIWTNHDCQTIDVEQLKTDAQHLRQCIGLPKSNEMQFKLHSDVETETYKAKSIVVA